MDNLKKILIAEIKKYAGKKEDWLLMPVFDEKRDYYLIVALDYRSHKTTDLLVSARIFEDKIVINMDMTDKKLVDALLQQGVPREQITLVYAGEPAPPPPIPIVINVNRGS